MSQFTLYNKTLLPFLVEQGVAGLELEHGSSFAGGGLGVACDLSIADPGLDVEEVSLSESLLLSSRSLSS